MSIHFISNSSLHLFEWYFFRLAKLACLQKRSPRKTKGLELRTTTTSTMACGTWSTSNSSCDKTTQSRQLCSWVGSKDSTLVVARGRPQLWMCALARPILDSLSNHATFQILSCSALRSLEKKIDGLAEVYVAKDASRQQKLWSLCYIKNILVSEFRN